MKTKKIKVWLFRLVTLAGIVGIASCNMEEDWLDEKSKLSDVRPTTLEDFQAILDDDNAVNSKFPGIGLSGADNYFMTDQNFNAADQSLKNSYIWGKDVFAGSMSADWTTAYQLVSSTNIVLDGLSKIERNSTNAADYDRIKATALFLRSFMYYTLSQTFCQPYSQQSLNLPGLVLREHSDVNQKSVRSTIAQTYDRMVQDMKSAIDGLPATTPYQMRPAKAAANALLAKIYLTMEDYEQAYNYSSAALKQFSMMLDFNSNLVSPTSSYRFPNYPNNPEILFYARQNLSRAVSAQSNALGYVDTTLYSMYEPDDLRRSLFFVARSGYYQFRGNYAASNNNFAGIATNEVLLIHAEASARIGKVDEANKDLNLLLKNRYRNGTFEPLDINDPEALLIKVLQERRKELPFTGQLRWEDLRRLNKDSRFAKTLIRYIDGVKYELAPNDKRYVFPIPDNEIRLSGIEQNER
ncbi:MAG: RagB/SusD family nutrient uptake outer membrane protein [Sphingobacterium sp.]|nr:RagB/SusD family nutrient uptake outer membrane protein [Sphingobacterium sp.]